MNDPRLHTFHIPVMGLAFTIDTPVRVAQYGIDSVISIMDDELAERMNAFYSKKFNFPYRETTKKVLDYRAKRITAYLNLVENIVQQKFKAFKEELAASSSVRDYFYSLLPDGNSVKKKLQELTEGGITLPESIAEYLDKILYPGAIDVNIMTKVDKENFNKGEALPVEFNDAHAALRGFAQSKLDSSLVLSAGMNPRLYSYIENFEDFFPDTDGRMKKKIVLKVSDFRSAQIQGRFLAQKGLWVSEFRIESGLNCGGHAFASDGYLLGPILEEFREKKSQLETSAYEMVCTVLERKGKIVPTVQPELKITVQGGVGTAAEHQFLMDHYQVDSVGWGSPFLLVEEATALDTETRDLLSNAGEEDLYLSGISPLGVPFHTVRNTTNQKLRDSRIAKNRPGSSCPKKYLALHTFNGEKQICTASRKYQEAQLKTLDREVLSAEVYRAEKDRITEKSCLCVGLANAAYLENDLPVKGEAQGVVICPGPNIAYFNKRATLQEMVGHIYGKENLLATENRPHMFIKELRLYLEAYENEVKEAGEHPSVQADKKVKRFKDNLSEGITYYEKLFSAMDIPEGDKTAIQKSLADARVKMKETEEILLSGIQL
ncbi:hypothetical protein ED312_06295 [Sinomicrobium pectinilyticum]|uniref:Uncharacterized protein n=1 Tax=Sinomicrobium pectinilyticum TaxID=1084421 RepID=A0A3N0ESD8_SINP1|nr:hypothetical protein [Sinomicrobium pectinilyticum]RNL90776.1 hypothetical protein ED312_06295 [Sinomicrobium pectinilyticum]